MEAINQHAADIMFFLGVVSAPAILEVIINYVNNTWCTFPDM